MRLDTNLNDVPFGIVKGLTEVFAPESVAWQQFVAEFQRRGYIVRKPGCVETTLLGLGTAGLTVKDVLNVCNRLRLEEPQMILMRRFEPVRVKVQPQKPKDGNNWLSCTATGFPYPHYQWVKDETMIPGATESLFMVDGCPACSNGVYSCRIWNYIDSEKPWFNFYAAPGKLHKSDATTDPVEVKWSEGLKNYSEKCLTKPTCAYCRPTIEDASAEPMTKLDPADGCSPTVTTEHPAVAPCFAVDKVALIIANSTYTHLAPLHAPMDDANTLSSLLMSLEFKTVTLTDLTLAEMNAVVKEYTKLLGYGVYALFYFVGHGVEYNGQCYLLPVDAPATRYTAADCVNAGEVLGNMQATRPALNTILLDICRKTPPQTFVDALAAIASPTSSAYRPNRNTVYGFATSCGVGAYEVSGESNGIFMKYLKNYLAQAVPVTKALESVLADVATDPKASEFQFPEIRHNLSAPRGLADPILVDGHTKTFNLRTYRWQCLHVLPEPRQVTVPAYGVRVGIWFDFYNYFTNAAYIYTSLELDPIVETAQVASSEELTVSKRLSENEVIEHVAILKLKNCLTIQETTIVASEFGKSSRFLVRDFQKLKGPLVCSFDIVNESNREVVGSSDEVLIGSVLISLLNL